MARTPPWLSAVYRPQPLAAWVGPVLTMILVVTSLARGVDYLTGEPSSDLLAYIEILGVRAWGYAWVTVGVGLALALLSRGLLPLVVAHLAATGLYAAYLIALMQGLVEAGTVDNVRIVAITAAGLGVHIVRVATLANEVAMITQEPLRRRATDPPYGRRATDFGHRPEHNPERRNRREGDDRPYGRRATDL